MGRLLAIKVQNFS